MRLLLDTHAFLWWINPHERLSRRAREALADGDNEIVVSTITPWEVAIKSAIGRFDMPRPLGPFFEREFAANGVRVLAVELAHAVAVRELPVFADHRDPFDRMLAAQARSEGLALVSADANFDRYGIERLW
ncbi:MAG: type II toxin-antitoxin system VapC family toxin [Rhodospirillales bacterium]|nr:type II toxin-antitoxin system VapC family toxin [Rhodospirillales bacterium]